VRKFRQSEKFEKKSETPLTEGKLYDIINHLKYFIILGRIKHF